MLEYLKPFIPKEFEELYQDILNYNEIYANGWDINTLYEMGKEDSYWKERADYFVKKYNIEEKDYDTDFLDKYFQLRDDLLDKLGIEDYVFDEKNDFDSDGYIESEIITSTNDLDEKNSFTVARVINFNHCIELHYTNDKAYLEYGQKINYDYWENEKVNIQWFNKSMSDDEVLDKLCELFENYKKNSYIVLEREQPGENIEL